MMVTITLLVITLIITQCNITRTSEKHMHEKNKLRTIRKYELRSATDAARVCWDDTIYPE